MQKFRFYLLGQATATSYLMSFLYESQIPDSITRVDVQNHYQQVPIRNVIGKIQGYQDPGQLKILGRMRDRLKH